ncbi:MAG: DUF1501 domain-containing protein [Verrucomicrobiae bacterium]|jgi:hypothetical protein|nr:DUF1501 domain-containing protein [Verrucomicrobiae bacterium]
MNQSSFLPSRRDMLKGCSAGFGWLAFQALSTQLSAAEQNPLAAKAPHFAPRAKRVIFLCMRGAPSHVDTFDYKPDLKRDTGKIGKGRRGEKLLGSLWDFQKHGQSGQWISELFPGVAKHADDICILNGMQTDIPNHPQAVVQMHTGNFQFVRPSLGAWTLYGLGTENSKLPGFITIAPPNGGGGSRNYGSSFLPAIYQGTPIGRERQRLAEARLPNIDNPQLGTDAQRRQLDLIQSLNHQKLERDRSNPAVEGIIESYELAFRMQAEVPKVMDVSSEPGHIREMYGIGDRTTGAFGAQCLLARRFVEAGVRFVEVSHSNWDQHRNLEAALSANCDQTDGPIAALLQDLKQRDLLKDTLVMWGGEFGRTPHAQNGNGRDHNNKGFTMWMAGGGVKGGLTYGMTDEYGYEAVENKVHIHDWHATILHLMGLNHERLTYRWAGRDFRLTDVHGNVVRDIIS